MIYVDTDNAMGSASRDVDDGYAIAALIRAGAPVAAIGAVAGNVPEEEAHRNNETLCALLGYACPLLRGRDARLFLHAFGGQVLALGPLTNVVAAAAAREVVVVGGRLHSIGRWPPHWPHEFNLTFDRAATLQLFRSGVPLTIIPLDVARKLWVHERDLRRLTGPFGEFARAETRRWFRYLALRRFTTRFAIYDLAAAMYAIEPAAFDMQLTTAAMKENTFLRFGRGSRRVNVCRDLDRTRLLELFLSVVR